MKSSAIKEGSAEIRIVLTEKTDRKMPVFYNPMMKLNRDISILLLNSIEKECLLVALPLAGSGIRGIRMRKELKEGKACLLDMNDASDNAVESLKRSLELNGIGFCTISNEQDNQERHKREDWQKGDGAATVRVSKNDANLFLLRSKGYDYIDIDPFGTPNPFIDSAVRRIARNGIIAITATDTAPLCGTYPKACRRKYWAEPSRTEIMHEAGIRILIRKAQLIGAQYDKALIPIYSYSRDHYFRVFLKAEFGKEMADEVLSKHGMFNDAGPMWLGSLWNEDLAENMLKNNAIPENDIFLRTIAKESKIKEIGFVNLHRLVKKSRSIKTIPQIEPLIEEIKKKGFPAERTHFSPYGIRTSLGEGEVERVVWEITKLDTRKKS